MSNITAHRQHIGSNVGIAESAQIFCDELIIGNDVVVDERVKIICRHGRVALGDQTFIGNDVTIILKSFEIGEYCKLHNHSLLNGKGTVTIGDNCWIGQNCILNGESDLIIGNNVGCGIYSSIWTHGYFGQLVDGCRIYSVKPTVIEDDVWLVGSYNTVFPGVTIGRQAVVMGTSVITKSIDSGRVYGGNPARDISDKIGQPYIPLSPAEKLSLIRDHIESYLIQENLPFTYQDDKLSVPGIGDIYFFLDDKPLPALSEDSAGFYNEVTDWSEIPFLSKFCLTGKLYQKRYSKTEILVKKILNPAVARFVKVQPNDS